MDSVALKGLVKFATFDESSQPKSCITSTSSSPQSRLDTLITGTSFTASAQLGFTQPPSPSSHAAQQSTGISTIPNFTVAPRSASLDLTRLTAHEAALCLKHVAGSVFWETPFYDVGRIKNIICNRDESASDLVLFKALSLDEMIQNADFQSDLRKHHVDVSDEQQILTGALVHRNFIENMVCEDPCLAMKLASLGACSGWADLRGILLGSAARVAPEEDSAAFTSTHRPDISEATLAHALCKVPVDHVIGVIVGGTSLPCRSDIPYDIHNYRYRTPAEKNGMRPPMLSIGDRSYACTVLTANSDATAHPNAIQSSLAGTPANSVDFMVFEYIPADVWINPRLPGEVSSEKPTLGDDWAVCNGGPLCLEDARDALKPGGRLLLVGIIGSQNFRGNSFHWMLEAQIETLGMHIDCVNGSLAQNAPQESRLSKAAVLENVEGLFSAQHLMKNHFMVILVKPAQTTQ